MEREADEVNVLRDRISIQQQRITQLRQDQAKELQAMGDKLVSVSQAARVGPLRVRRCRFALRRANAHPNRPFTHCIHCGPPLAEALHPTLSGEEGDRDAQSSVNGVGGREGAGRGRGRRSGRRRGKRRGKRRGLATSSCPAFSLSSPSSGPATNSSSFSSQISPAPPRPRNPARPARPAHPARPARPARGACDGRRHQGGSSRGAEVPARPPRPHPRCAAQAQPDGRAGGKGVAKDV